MRIGPCFNQPLRFLYRFIEPNILHGDPQQFTAGPVIFHDSEAKVLRVERTGRDSLVAERLHIGDWKCLFHLPIWCKPLAKRCTKYFYQSDY